MDDYVVFILSHGRPDKVITYRTLRRQGYTGPIYIVIDNEDKTADRYYELYGDQVVMFDKAAVAARIDEGDNFKDRRAVIYARNACFDIAEQLGYRYFIQLDDDYTHFRYMLDGELRSLYVTRYVVSLDAVFDIVFAFYKSIPAKTIAFAQGGDVIGGGDSSGLKRVWLKRKAMNSFFVTPLVASSFSDVLTRMLIHMFWVIHVADYFFSFIAWCYHRFPRRNLMVVCLGYITIVGHILSHFIRLCMRRRVVRCIQLVFTIPVSTTA